MAKTRAKPKPVSEHKAIIRAANTLGKTTIPCPFCADHRQVPLNKFGIHCVGGHKMNRAKINGGLEERDPSSFAKLEQYRTASLLAHRSKNALRSLGEKYASQRGHDKEDTVEENLPVVMPKRVPQRRPRHEIEVPPADVDGGEEVNETQQMAEQMAHQAAAVSTLQNAAVMVQCATMLNQFGPEQMAMMLQGISRMGNLPRPKRG
jgi:hypothetical protein